MARTLERPTVKPRRQLKPRLQRDLQGTFSIWQREMIRFFRERSRAVTQFVQPLLYLLVFGTGLGAAVRTDAVAGQNYRVFLLPGVIVMTALFTSMFGAMTIVWDREFGFLREVLVAPVGRASIIAGKALGGATTAGIQGIAILIFAPVVGLHLDWTRVVKVIPALLLFALTINLLGIALAARMTTMQGFMVIMNFITLPLFFLSGAIFPLTTIPGWLRVGAVIDPATYAVDAIRHSLIPAYPQTELWAGATLHYGIDMAVLAVLGAVMFVLATRGLNRQP
jgi:ABC-2 type transport system permease protein